jgi:UDP-hydrolysing UDP-N-acetyl-D-glucosamine 2-epimerase
VLSTGRQDWGVIRSTCALLRDDPGFELALMLGGMHCSPRYGLTLRLVEEEGFEPVCLMDWARRGQDGSAAREAGDATGMMGEALAEIRPDMLLMVGDRFETAAAALAATLVRVPIVHLHGGEETEGAIDNALRHAITKQAHLHLVSHQSHADRVVAMGEDPATVHVVGAPGLDNLHRPDLPGRDELGRSLGLELRLPVVLVTLHPETLAARPGDEAVAVCAAMNEVDATYVITLPNADPGNEATRAAMTSAAHRPGRTAVEALGERRYWGLMRQADAMLGNSSSALIEAPALGLPAVNVGDRQKGRLRGRNVIDVPANARVVTAGLRQALSPAFRSAARRATSPYGDGHSGRRIIDVLRRWSPPNPPVKHGVACAVT